MVGKTTKSSSLKASHTFVMIGVVSSRHFQLKEAGATLAELEGRFIEPSINMSHVRYKTQPENRFGGTCFHFSTPFDTNKHTLKYYTVPLNPKTAAVTPVAAR